MKNKKSIEKNNKEKLNNSSKLRPKEQKQRKEKVKKKRKQKAQGSLGLAADMQLFDLISQKTPKANQG